MECCTVLGNEGTILQHCLTARMIRALAVGDRSSTAVRIVDTHAMAPVNRPIGSSFLDQVLDCPRAIQSAGPFSAALRGAARRRARGVAQYFPALTLTAVAALRDAYQTGTCPTVRAWLFENDGSGQPNFSGRRDAWQKILADPIALDDFGIDRDWFHFELAPDLGDFRQSACWPSAQTWRESILLLVTDATSLLPKHSLGETSPFPASMYLNDSDLRTLLERIADHCATPPKSWAHVAFLACAGRTRDSGGKITREPVDAKRSAQRWFQIMGSARSLRPTAAAVMSWGGYQVLCGIGTGPNQTPSIESSVALGAVIDASAAWLREIGGAPQVVRVHSGPATEN